MRYIGDSIRVPEDYDDLVKMWQWIERQHTLALDTETTGLDIYSEDHRLRLIALATPTEAWVFPYETCSNYRQSIELALMSKRLIMHNASYDIQVLVRNLPRREIQEWWSQTKDTKILAHQVDPRGRDEGGIGQSLDELVKHYMPEYAKLGDDLKSMWRHICDSYKVWIKIPEDEYPEGGYMGFPEGFKPQDMWRNIPIDNEMYLLYAGTDAILTARLFQILSKQVDVNSELTKLDHKVAMIASMMDAKGFLCDREYTETLRESLIKHEAEQKAEAASFGLENINSPQQVAEALAARGLVPDQSTPKGNPKVDKVFLNKHQEDPLVLAIIEGKKAGKWRTTWVEKFLNNLDLDNRVHPSTNTLRARTARFSITGIPAQTLPATDHLIRSCFVADEGEIIVGVDYAQQELRFAAAKAPDVRMIQAFRNGEDLHFITAETAWPGRGEEMRKYGKGGNFATVYGGGERALMDQFGMTQEQARAVRTAIKKAYPGLAQLQQRLSEEASQRGYVTTWTGRRLPVDENRLYSASNYFIQSGCRDLTAYAMVRLYDAGFVEHMRLAIHDEILLSLPDDNGVIREVEQIMSTKVGPLEIPAEAKVGQRAWGSLYLKD